MTCDNFTREEQEGLKSLKNMDDIVIKPADKGGKVCVWDKDLYVQEGVRQLQDEQFYNKLPKDITEDIQKKVKDEINKMIEEGDMSEGSRCLNMRAPKCAVFYMLPKIHKADIPGRPVISNISCPTYELSKFLSGILRPIVEKCPTFVKDTTHLLQRLKDVHFETESDNNILFTMDVKGLYTNIPNADGLQALKYFLEKEDNLQIPIHCILRLAELVLTLNCFEFDGQCYSQISGTMMGSPFSVNYSCLAMSHQEVLVDEAYGGEKPMIYLRYIDDIVGVSTMTREHLDEFITFVQGFNPALDYSVDVGRRVNMLDATLYVSGDGISSTLYSKPTDSHAYLRYDSSHPRACKDNIPYAQFLRLRKICSDKKDYKEKAAEMGAFFINQGYPRRLVELKRRKAERVDRASLLEEKTPAVEKNDRIVFPVLYHPTNIKMTSTIKENYKRLGRDDEVGDLFTEPPMVAFRRDRNLRDMLVHSRIKRKDEVGRTNACGRTRCKTCDHICEDEKVVGPKGVFYVKRKFNCKSAGVVYCIVCNRCGDLYVGETGRMLSERFREHRQDVIQDREGKEIASHFNRNGHCLEDMKVLCLTFESNLVLRKLTEQKIIAKLGCYLGGGLNTDFRFPSLIAH